MHANSLTPKILLNPPLQRRKCLAMRVAAIGMPTSCQSCAYVFATHSAFIKLNSGFMVAFPRQIRRDSRLTHLAHFQRSTSPFEKGGPRGICGACKLVDSENPPQSSFAKEEVPCSERDHDWHANLLLILRLRFRYAPLFRDYHRRRFLLWPLRFFAWVGGLIGNFIATL